MKRLACHWWVVLVLSGNLAWAGPFPSNAVEQLTRDYLARRPSHSLHAGMSLAEARQIAAAFVERLVPELGPPVGYKAGLISTTAQKAMSASGPIHGVLLSKMMLPTGVRVPVDFGARPVWEPDLVVVVKDEGINAVTTLLGVAQHLSEVVAFIELPDRIVAPDEKLDGHLITAINASARLGVLGERRKIEGSPAFVEAFAAMEVTARDQDGMELARGRGQDLMGNPLEVVLWLIRELRASGAKLKPGDLLSLGTFAPAAPPKAGQRITARYDGLPGGPMSVAVEFAGPRSK